MRKALYDFLTTAGYRVYQPYSPLNTTVKPFVVVKFASPVEMNGGDFDVFEVWPYLSKGSFLLVDDMVDALMALLDKATITCLDGRRFCVEWMMTGPDFQDDALIALTRFLRFRVPARPAK